MDTQRAPGPAPLAQLATLVRDLQPQNLELAGRVGFLPSQLQAASDRLRPLEGAKDLTPAEQGRVHRNHRGARGSGGDARPMLNYQRPEQALLVALLGTGGLLLVGIFTPIHPALLLALIFIVLLAAAELGRA
jgi:hypothetical protein